MKTRALRVFPLAPDPIRPGVGRDALAARLTIDPVGPEDSLRYAGPGAALPDVGVSRTAHGPSARDLRGAERRAGRPSPGALVDELVDDPGPLGEDVGDRPVGVRRTESQAIDVDGVTHIHPDEGLAPGAFVTGEIEDSQDHDLIGRVVEAS